MIEGTTPKIIDILYRDSLALLSYGSKDARLKRDRDNLISLLKDLLEASTLGNECTKNFILAVKAKPTIPNIREAFIFATTPKSQLVQSTQTPQESMEAQDKSTRFLQTILSKGDNSDTVGDRFTILDQQAKHLALDKLLSIVIDEGKAIPALASIINSNVLSPKDAKSVIDNLIETVTLHGNPDHQIKVLETFNATTLTCGNTDLKKTFFKILIKIIFLDQYAQVNPLVPAIIKHQADIPSELYADYLKALIDQTNSASHRGSPAAKVAIRNLPQEIITAGIITFNANYLWSNQSNAHFVSFLKNNIHLAPKNLQQYFNDATSLSPTAFWQKHISQEDPQ